VWNTKHTLILVRAQLSLIYAMHTFSWKQHVQMSELLFLDQRLLVLREGSFVFSSLFFHIFCRGRGGEKLVEEGGVIWLRRYY
jgi:hypothetical protein